MATKATWMSVFFIFAFALTPFVKAATSSSNHSFLRMRNRYLRMYLAYKKETVKQKMLCSKDVLKDKANAIYQSVLSKYYDAWGIYYGLPAEDRELIDQIINLHF